MRNLATTFIVLAVYAPLVFADGCVDRPDTPQERTAYQSAYNATKAALPVVPKDMIMKDKTGSSEGPSYETTHKVCVGTDMPVRYGFRFSYEYDEAGASAQQTQGFQIKGTPAQQAQLADLDAKIEKLKEARKLARKGGSDAEQSRIKEDLAAAQQERRKIGGEMVGALINDRATARVQNTEVSVLMNENRPYARKCDQPVNVAGSSLAFWCQEYQGYNGGILVIFLGSWNKTSETSFDAKLAQTHLVTKPQSIVIAISAERQMAESMAQQMKLSLLKAQLSGP